MGDFFLYAGLLLAGFSAFLIVHALLSTNQEQNALSWATGNEPVKSKSGFLEFSRPFVHKFCLGFAAKVKSPTYRQNVKKKIALAGLEREINVDEFIGIQILWGVALPVTLVLLNFTLELGYPFAFVLFLGAFGFWFPHYHCKQQRYERQVAVLADLPFFIDLLALSTEAGLDFINSIQRVVDKAQNSVLADELSQVLRDIKLGSARAEALKKMADRLDMSEVTSFVVVLIDADSTGASISKVLKDQSVQMRLERFTRAEKAGARAAQLILVPLLIFILPAVFITVFGPIVLQFMGGG